MPSKAGAARSANMDQNQDKIKSAFKSALLDYDAALINFFINNALRYTRLAIAGLAVSMFTHEIVEIEGYASVFTNIFLVISWVCFSVSVGTGLYYQRMAVKFLDAMEELETDRFGFFPASLIRRSSSMYLVIRGAFYVGSFFFFVDLFRKLEVV